MCGKDTYERARSFPDNGYRMPKVISTETQAEVFPFLELPTELRNMIPLRNITQKLHLSLRVTFSIWRQYRISNANRQIYQEACSVLYSNARGIVCNESHLLSRACCCYDFLTNPLVAHVCV